MPIVFAQSVIVVAHKGTVRVIAEKLSRVELEPHLPELGGVIQVIRRPGGHWHLGRRGPI